MLTNKIKHSIKRSTTSKEGSRRNLLVRKNKINPSQGIRLKIRKKSEKRPMLLFNFDQKKREKLKV